MTERTRFALLALLLSTLSVLMPLGTDIFLPSIPDFARTMNVEVGIAELTIATFFAGNAAGQLVWGPASDRFGRKPVIVAALLLYFAAAGAVASAESFGLVLFCRFVQGISAASGRILAQSAARDLYERERLAKLIAFVMTFAALSAMLTGPTGGFIADNYSWRAAFAVTAGFAALSLTLFLIFFKETIAEKNPLAIRPLTMLATSIDIVRSRVFRAYVLVGACGMAGMVAFLNSSAGILIGNLGVEPSRYGLMFAILPLGFMTGSILVGRYVEKVGAERFLVAGTAIMALAGLAMLALAIVGVERAETIFLPMTLYLMGFAFVMPQSTSGALSPFGRVAGTASSLHGFFQSMVGAGMSLTLAVFGDGTILPMAAAIALAGFASFGVYRFMIRPRRAPLS